MAEKLPRYRPLGVSIASMPSIDYMTAAKMKARGFDQTAAALDKLSSFAFAKAGEYKVEEAQKFRYDNPVTAEQLQTAISSGRDIDEIIGDNYTIFGRASRATVGVQLRTELESQARSQMSAISAAIDSGMDLDVDQLRSQFEGMISGHSDLLAEVDPSEAYKYSAVVNTLAAPIYKNALVQEYKKKQDIAEFNTRSQFLELPNALAGIFTADAGGKVPDANGKDILESESTAKAFVISLANDAFNANNPDLANEIMKEGDKLIDDAKENALVRFGIDNPDKDITMGDFGDKTALWNSVDEKQKESVKERIRKEREKRQTKKGEEETASQKANAKLFNGHLDIIAGMSEAEPGVDIQTTIRNAYTTGRDSGLTTTQVKSQIESAQKQKQNPTTVAALEFEERVKDNDFPTLPALYAAAKDAGFTKDDVARWGWISKQGDALDVAIKADNEEAEALLQIQFGISSLKEVMQRAPVVAQAYMSHRFAVDDKHAELVQAWKDGGSSGPRPKKRDVALEQARVIAASEPATQITNLLVTLNANYALGNNDVWTQRNYKEINVNNLNVTDTKKNKINEVVQQISDAEQRLTAIRSGP